MSTINLELLVEKDVSKSCLEALSIGNKTWDECEDYGLNERSAALTLQHEQSISSSHSVDGSNVDRALAVNQKCVLHVNPTYYAGVVL